MKGAGRGVKNKDGNVGGARKGEARAGRAGRGVRSKDGTGGGMRKGHEGAGRAGRAGRGMLITITMFKGVPTLGMNTSALNSTSPSALK